MILVDTSVFIDHLRGRTEATSFVQAALVSGAELVASEVTRFELLAGARPSEMAGLEDVAGVVSWVPVTDDVARRAGEYARAHRRSHQGIGAVDYLLAGTASLLGASLATMNVRHFPMFPGLTAPYGYAASDGRP